MADQNQPQIVIHTQYIKDFSFENPNAPQALISAEGQPEIEINVNVSANPQEQERFFEVVLSITANAKREDNQLFIAELSYAAVISIDQAVEDRHIHPLVMIEGPRMVFPFARHILSSITQAGGFMPLNIQPIDFVRIYQAGMESRNANQAVAPDNDADNDGDIDGGAANGSAEKDSKAPKKGKKKS